MHAYHKHLPSNQFSQARQMCQTLIAGKKETPRPDFFPVLFIAQLIRTHSYFPLPLIIGTIKKKKKNEKKTDRESANEDREEKKQHLISTLYIQKQKKKRKNTAQENE